MLTERGIDDAAGLVLTYGSGAVATRHLRAERRDRLDRDRRRRPRPDRRGGSDHGAAACCDVVTSTTAEPEVVAEPLIGIGMAHEAIEVQRCLRAGPTESPLVPLDETLLVARLLDRARQVCGVRLPGDG